MKDLILFILINFSATVDCFFKEIDIILDNINIQYFLIHLIYKNK